jgi:predicted ArsR family transcriptional regulator
MSGKADGYHAALASGTRRLIVDALTASPIPLDAQSLAAQVGIHVTTARFHLDQLERVSLVRRQTGVHQRRGRPSVLYTPTGEPRDDSTRAALINVLVGALGDRGDGPDASAEAGRRWADHFDLPGSDRTAVTELLEQLGFEPEPDEDTVRLRSCPFRDAARAHPEIVCSVHRGLLERVVQNRDGSSDVDIRLIPFVEPELCLVAFADRSDPAVSVGGPS